MLTKQIVSCEMRLTLKVVENFAEKYGINVERSGREIEIWSDDYEPGVTHVVYTMQEAYDTVTHIAWCMDIDKTINEIRKMKG